MVQLIMKALDEDGDPLFDMGDKLKLMNNVGQQPSKRGQNTNMRYKVTFYLSYRVAGN
mgnify:CR=1 FL=1